MAGSIGWTGVTCSGGSICAGSIASTWLWSPSHPNLYTARLVATAAATGGGPGSTPTPASGYTVLSGVRSIRVDSSGQLVLNGTAIYFTLQEFRCSPPGTGESRCPIRPSTRRA
jgi:hypothetical protein